MLSTSIDKYKRACFRVLYGSSLPTTSRSQPVQPASPASHSIQPVRQSTPYQAQLLRPLEASRSLSTSLPWSTSTNRRPPPCIPSSFSRSSRPLSRFKGPSLPQLSASTSWPAASRSVKRATAARATSAWCASAPLGAATRRRAQPAALRESPFDQGPLPPSFARTSCEQFQRVMLTYVLDGSLGAAVPAGTSGVALSAKLRRARLTRLDNGTSEGRRTIVRGVADIDEYTQPVGLDGYCKLCYTWYGSFHVHSSSIGTSMYCNNQFSPTHKPMCSPRLLLEHV